LTVKLRVVIRPEKEGGYSVALPAIPGCVSCGDTVEEALANIREAAEALLEVANEQDPWEGLGLEPAEPIVREIEL
jgi:predicted RNase H-like HicB family nuclease